MMTYRVQKGDTLSKIAKKFNTTVDSIAKANHIGNVNIIQIDQVLIIPTESLDVKWKTFTYCVKAIENLPEFEELMRLM